MDFFERQEATRRQTRLLVLLFLVATLLITGAVALVVAIVAASFGMHESAVVVPDARWAQDNLALLTLSSLATVGFIGVASLYRTLRLRSVGGSGVARGLGGTQIPADTADPLRTRLRNVIEEMAIASGSPVPDIYVLEAEPGINAFAAGYSPGNAAIAVTHGALEQLSRDELQGVIAHEFSHVLNGDMRLNMRLMGLLFGILAIGLVGRAVLQSGRYGRVRTSRRGGGSGVAVLLLAGLALFLIGYIGVFCGRLIKAGASRERERLADASAVQFTRQTEGLAGALKKIAGLEAGSTLKAADGEEVSHMLFARGLPALTRLMATHPPIGERIRALDPEFDPRDLDRLRAEGLARTLAAPDDEAAATSAVAPPAPPAAATPEAVIATAGTPGDSHIRYARELRSAIPRRLYQAAHSPADAAMLVIALILHPDEDVRRRQLEQVGQRYGRARRVTVERLYGDLRDFGDTLRLPLLDLALPALRHRPQEHLDYLAGQVRELACLDERVELFEYALMRVLEIELGIDARQTDRAGRARDANTPRRAVLALLAIVARHGHRSSDAAAAAWAHGVGIALGADAVPPELPEVTHQVDVLDAALDTLRPLRGPSRRRLVEAVAAVIVHDRRITAGEAELLRAVCATLDTPLPPLGGAYTPVTA